MYLWVVSPSLYCDVIVDRKRNRIYRKSKISSRAFWYQRVHRNDVIVLGSVWPRIHFHLAIVISSSFYRFASRGSLGCFHCALSTMRMFPDVSLLHCPLCVFTKNSFNNVVPFVFKSEVYLLNRKAKLNRLRDARRPAECQMDMMLLCKVTLIYT